MVTHSSSKTLSPASSLLRPVLLKKRRRDVSFLDSFLVKLEEQCQANNLKNNPTKPAATKRARAPHRPQSYDHTLPLHPRSLTPSFQHRRLGESNPTCSLNTSIVPAPGSGSGATSITQKETSPCIQGDNMRLPGFKGLQVSRGILLSPQNDSWAFPSAA